MIATPLFQVKGISRSFGKFQAVKPIDFNINGTEVIILTGPNGAGKTTLLHCLSGMLRPTSGYVLVEGYDLYRDEVEVKQRMAFVPDVPRFYQELTTWEHLRFICLAFDMVQGWEVQAEAMLKEFGLWDSRDMFPHQLSRGMRLKLGICMALIRPFKMLLMDEPTSALDMQSARLVNEKLSALRSNGCAILLTSHDLSMVEALNGKRWQMEQGQVEFS